MESHTEVGKKIDADFAGRCWDGLWGNPLCFLLSVFTTSLLSRHRTAMYLAGGAFSLFTVVRFLLLVRKSWFDAPGERTWRHCANAIVLLNGAGWGLLAAFLFYWDGYQHPDVMVLLLYVSAIGASGVRLLMHTVGWMRLYLAVLYVPLVLVHLAFPHGSRWAPLLGFVLYTAFLIVNGKRSHKEYLNQIHDNQALSRIAKVDFLTGVANRFWFGSLLEDELNSAAEKGTRLALLFIDLNDFKRINDFYSHQTGDLFLIETARKLRAAAPDGTVARLGGDEFAVFLTGPLTRKVVADRVRSILLSLHSPTHIGESLLSGGASVGISLFPDDAIDSRDLLRQADRAMYAAKKGGGCGFYFADELCPGKGDICLSCPETTCHQTGEWVTALGVIAELGRAELGRAELGTSELGTSEQVVRL